MTTYEKILQIKENVPFSEIQNPDELSIIAAITYQHIKTSDISTDLISRRVARMLISDDFHNLTDIPEKYKGYIITSFAKWNTQITRTTMDDYMSILNAQDTELLKSCSKVSGVSRFFTPNTLKTLKMDKVPVTKQTSKKTNVTKNLYIPDTGDFDFSSAGLSDSSELSPQSFLKRPVAQQTKALLEEMLDSDMVFPENFIESLQTPNKNEAFYKAHGNEELAKVWKARIIPFLNKDVCMHIADFHPEASIRTPSYLKAKSVNAFWERLIQANTSKVVLTSYFLKFPEKAENKSFIDNINISWEVLAHAPTFLVGSEQARIYLNAHPNDIFRLPEVYQEERRILADGVAITKGNIPLIKNDTLRQNVALAFNISED